MSNINSSARGHLTIGGCDAVTLAQRFGTPLYVVDEARIRRACREYVRCFAAHYPKSRIIYAGKAFMNKAIVVLVMEEGLCIDICSGGELHTALAAGCTGDQLFFHGNSKTPSEIELGLDAGVHRFISDSLDELRLIDAIARSRGQIANVMLRLTPGIEAHTHDYIRTGQIDSKFGVVIANGDAMRTVAFAKSLKNLRLTGIHCHIGSQVFEVEPFVDAVNIMMDFAREARDQTGLVIEELNLGGGLGIAYNTGDRPTTVDDLASAVGPAVQNAAVRCGLPLPTLMLEPGRSIVGEAGTTLYTVNTVKHIEGVRTYVSVDGGMADNPRVALYQAQYDAVLANKVSMEPAEKVSIAGNCCESGDMLIYDIDLPEAEVGDTVAVFCTGAYNFSMASNYNRHPRPAAVLVANGQADVIAQRETYADTCRLDTVPARLLRACAHVAAGENA